MIRIALSKNALLKLNINAKIKKMSLTKTNQLIAIFAGSFDPFHQGHKSIVNKALKIFNQIIILVSTSDEKKNHQSLEQRYQAVKKQVKIKNVLVDKLTDKYVADYAKKHAIKYLVRSARDCQDFNYELLVNQTNKKLNSTLETILFFPDQITSNIRSSNLK